MSLKKGEGGRRYTILSVEEGFWFTKRQQTKPAVHNRRSAFERENARERERERMRERERERREGEREREKERERERRREGERERDEVPDEQKKKDCVKQFQ